MEQTAEEIVATSDARAVRTAFDERNLGWFRTMLGLLIAYFLLFFIADVARGLWLRVLEIAANLAIDITLLVAVSEKWRSPLKPFVREHLSAVIIAAMTLQSFVGLLLAPRTTDLAIPWIMSYPWFMTGFRMFAVELTLLHGSLSAIGIVDAMLLPPKEKGGFIAGAIVMNALPLLIGLLASRRRRRDVLAAFHERRRHAAEVVRMRDELQYAREIQLSMLPEAPPDLSWVDVAGISIPATEVGGDYYDYFVVGDRLAIVSGDVAGHGLASGIMLATLRSGFTLMRDALTDPAAVLSRLHDLVAETSRRRTLVTCAVVLLDREGRRATVASAGHPPVIVKHAAAAQTLELFAPPLGVKLNFEVAQSEIPLQAGDVFVLHTDGIYESMNAGGESYGLERMISLVSQAKDGSARELRDTIVGDVERFRGSEKQRDDITLVVATIRAC